MRTKSPQLTMIPVSATVVEGYLVDPKYQLTNAQSIAGNASFASVSGSEEVGHKGDGFVRITLMK